MRIIRHYLKCDRCRAEVDLKGPRVTPAVIFDLGWWTGRVLLRSRTRTLHICGECIADWLDPSGDVMEDLRRDAIEDALNDLRRSV